MKWNWLYVLWIGFTLLAFGTSTILGFAMVGMLAVLVRLDAGISVLKQIHVELKYARLEGGYGVPREPQAQTTSPAGTPRSELGVPELVGGR
jgi:hypothetical protein